MSDKEIIIKALDRIERRIRANRILDELGLGTAFFLAFPLACKLWDIVDPFRASTIATIAGTWILLFAGYVVWCSLRKPPVTGAAASIDKAADLKDEIKTAVWFIHNPRPSDWVDTQIHRAASRTRSINIDQLFPRHYPKTLYYASAFLVAFIALNFVPLPWNHNWLKLQAAPAFSLTRQEMEILKQTQALLKKANEEQQTELAEKLEDIVDQLQQGKLDAAEVLQKLDALRTQLDEGNLDAAAMREGLEEMAKSLEQAKELESSANAIKNRDLNMAADELRKAAEKLSESRSRWRKASSRPRKTRAPGWKTWQNCSRKPPRI